LGEGISGWWQQPGDAHDPAFGGVHLGAVYVADAAGRPVEIRETDKLTGSFATAADVNAVRDDLETWSRLVFDFLEGQAAG